MWYGRGMSVKRSVALGEYYHVYNRGAHKQGIFREQADWARFLFGLIYFQSPTPFKNISRRARTFDPQSGYEVRESEFRHVYDARSVELVAFCLMENHFHLIVREIREGGVSRYLQRVQESYAKYFNEKYQCPGHVFEGPFKAKLVPDNEYLMHLSAYIHRNPRDMPKWKRSYDAYPWSSCTDYVRENRWGGLLAQEIILDQFAGTKESNYADFVRSSPAKGFDFSV